MKKNFIEIKSSDGLNEIDRLEKYVMRTFIFSGIVYTSTIVYVLSLMIGS